MKVFEVEKRIDPKVNFGIDPRAFRERVRCWLILVCHETEINHLDVLSSEQNLATNVVEAPEYVITQFDATSSLFHGVRIEFQREFRGFANTKIRIVAILDYPRIDSNVEIVHERVF